MKNIYDIRQENQDVYILSCNAAPNINMNIKCAIIVCLYYVENIDFYLNYISNIPEEIPIYIYSSNIECLSCVKEKIKRIEIVYSQKVNRGRDISTLLVAARSVIKKYELICFIHDKSTNAEYLKNDVEYWNKNLWDNMLHSSNYIYNILQKFYENSDLGVLVPPEPYGEYISAWYGDTWYDNYDLTVNLAEKLKIRADICANKNVYTLGTVFWARTDALIKLLDYEWSYEDFPDEPLPNDGTISHAVERIIGYVAYDAGYKTGTVMTDNYAAELLLKVQHDMRKIVSMAEEKEHVFNIYQIKNIESWKVKLKQYVSEHAKVYIYGAGNYGSAIKKIMNDNHLVLSGFIVSQGRRNLSRVENINVYELQEIGNQVGIGIIIGVSYEYRKEIHEILEENGFFDYLDGF